MIPNMETVKAVYRRQLIQNIDALLVARRSLLDGDQRVRKSIGRIAHNLMGSGETLGFPEVSRAAALVGRAAEGELYVALDNLLGELRRAVVDPDARHRVVLCVEDEPAIQSVVRMIAAPWTEKVVGVATAAAAREFLEKERPSMILLDLMLPDVDGRAFLMELTQDPTLRRTPIVILSASANAQVRTECLALGAVEVHEKPIDPVSLSTCIATLCGHESRTTLQMSGDLVTGLLDRDMFAESARQVRMAFDVDRRPWANIVIELEDLDGITASGGQAAGTEALRSVATVLRNVFHRPEQIVTRWSQGLFVVLSPNDIDDSAEELTNAALEAIRMLDGPDGKLSAHAGGVRCGAVDPSEALVVARRMKTLGRDARSMTAVMSSLLRPMSPRRVLVADDDPSIRKILAALLSSDDYDIILRDSGPEAQDALNQMKFDLVILDIDMPGRSGLEVLRDLRKSKRHAKTPVMMLSSYGKERHIVDGFEAGANDYVTKPFQPRVLQMRIRNLLASH